MTAPLQGIRILDISQLFPGPLCTMILADLGAEVIKVEPVGTGDYARFFGYFFDQINRNKKSIALNLKDPEAQKLFHRLAETADVVVEGFRPGTTARLGVDYPTIQAINPRIVYCSISGFGQDGPYRDRPGHDINYMSIGGALGLMRDRKGRPVEPGVEVADITSAMDSVIGILAALFARQMSGEGQFVDISMLDCVVALLPMNAGIYLDTGEQPPKSPLHALPHYRVFDAADGGYLAIGIVHEDWFWKELCDALQMDDVKDLKTMERAMREEELGSRLEEIFRSRDLEEWLDHLSGYDIPYSKVNNIAEALSDPQVRHREMVVEIPAGEKTYRQLGSPFKLSGTPVRLESPPPRLGEHTEALLKEIGLAEEEIIKLSDTGAIQ